MPRLHHLKTRTGCQRCKLRKVKCDEARPRCGACARHDVQCAYSAVQPDSMSRAQQRTAAHAAEIRPHPVHNEHEPTSSSVDPLLETRLMHEWTAYACHTFSTAWEFWKYQAPLIAFEHRYVLDGLLCLAALHATRQTTIRTTGSKNTVIEMPHLAKVYFQRAIDGHRKALVDLRRDNIEAAYVACTCVTFAALVALREQDSSPSFPADSSVQWLRLARGLKFLVNKWRELAGDSVVMQSEIIRSKPDLSNPEQLYRRENAEPFERLLTWAEDYEALTPEDRGVYEKALSYIGLIYRGIVEGSDHPYGTCRRIIAMTSLLPERFVEMVELGRPRALAMMMHVYACMKMVEGDVFWFEGIAEQQIPRLLEQMPNAWKTVVQWPLSVINVDPIASTDKAVLSA